MHDAIIQCGERKGGVESCFSWPMNFVCPGFLQANLSVHAFQKFNRPSLFSPPRRVPQRAASDDRAIGVSAGIYQRHRDVGVTLVSGRLALINPDPQEPVALPIDWCPYFNTHDFGSGSQASRVAVGGITFGN
jgi:hypothetical protein